METSIAHQGSKKGEGISEDVTSRIRRGISHYAEFASGIERIADGVYLVPSSTGYGKYRVETSLTEDGVDDCTCVDFRRHGHETGCCKHTVAAMIYEARLVMERTEADERDDDMLDACATGLSRMPGTAALEVEKPRYGLGEDLRYDGDERYYVYEYKGHGEHRTRRLITITGSSLCAIRDIEDLSAGRAPELLRKCERPAIPYPDRRKAVA